MRQWGSPDAYIYRELGGNYFDKLNPARTLRKPSCRVEKLGYQLMPTQPAIAPNSVDTSPDGVLITGWQKAKQLETLSD